MWKLWNKHGNALKSHSNRVERALQGRIDVVNDFFGGWEPEDLEKLAKYQYRDIVPPEPNQIVDWLGIKTDARLHSWMGEVPEGIHIDDIPIPDDMVHAETIEYIALIVAIEKAKKLSRRTFTCFEIGASYAPWSTAAGILAKREGFEKIRLLALEANEKTIPKIYSHAQKNNLIPDHSIQFEAIHGAIFTCDQPLNFPVVDTTQDNGARISLDTSSTDYRGVPVSYTKVRGYSLETLSQHYETIDLFHIDVQGAEKLLLEDEIFPQILTDKVSTLFLATQTRGIEGLALETLSKLGWSLLRERPTVYKENGNTNNIDGWTLRDGGQLWTNNSIR